MAVSNMTRIRKRQKVKANVIDQVLLHRDQAKTVKMEEVQQKEMSRKAHQSVWKTESAFVFRQLDRKVHETVMRFLASTRMCQTQDEKKLQIWAKVCISYFRTTMERQAKKSEEKRLFQLYAVTPCASQDVELPEQTFGPTNARQSILKKNGKTTPRWCKKRSLVMGQTFVRNSRNELGKRSYILQTEDGMESCVKALDGC